MSEDSGSLILPPEILEEWRQLMSCDHDWLPGVPKESGWRSRPYQVCSKCKSVRLRWSSGEWEEPHDHEWRNRLGPGL